MIAERAPRYTPHMASHRILYVGDDIYLPARLGDALKSLDCFVVRSPVETARILIQSEIKYSLLVFDETEAGAGLEAYARSLSHRKRTPIIFVKGSEGLDVLVYAIRRKLVGL
ncbi:MAG TPA: hypothetical protein VKB12_13695 [Pyrinomonadaceae bacterium]|nr:hypothetical protein [Pyrinomonadaceae bacterium]